VSAFAVPAKTGAGAIITVTDTTINQGAGAAGPSITRFFLSANFQLDSSDVLLNGSRAVPALSSGGTSIGATAITIPPATATGQYYLIAKADADSTEVETQEGNNTKYASVAVGPDLVLSNSSVQYSIPAGSSVLVTSTITNQGGGPADPSTIRFYLSSNLVLDGTDVLLPGSLAVPSLAAGASAPGSALVTIPSGTATGSQFLIIKADADNAVGEVQEGNNVAPKAIQVTSGS
jgi:subtilase family serine protease